MNFNEYKTKLGVGRVHTDGQRHRYEARNIIEETWYSDPTHTVGWFYDAEHDDQPNENTDLRPEGSGTKIPIEIKFMVNSYRTLNKDEVDNRIMFKPSYKCNIPYYKDKYEIPTNSVFPTGLFVDLKNKDGIYNRWLVVSTASANNSEFPTWSVLPCGHKFQWVDGGKKKEMWGVERSQSSYTSGVWHDHVFESTDNITKCILPYNETTKTLFYNKRIIISVDLPEPLAWRVSKVEPFANRGNILYTFKEDNYDQHHDVIERDDSGRIIGMWADLINESNLPSYIPAEIDPTLSGNYAEITYAGAEPHIKVKGSYKAVTIAYYNSNELINDQTPGEWSYYIDDTDASELVKVIEGNSSNTIKIKFLGDEEYIGKVLTVKNNRDGLVAELPLQIVSL
ncbi:hypothetical protein SAMN05660484_02247 [Eubacterium ruminantium]|uniref:Uncharacterized protein n=1 Tax=Eubacterium ruminantium TaxID=42322 RepID=A0A1T4Q4Q7_9FIRM|nr:hypothetical protein [Eubacterium ruminantium]SCW64424.1 hypothetical protein SAMN05660484_02247 [Eubacterium ruminantium]SDN29865.1 hypothetical protein SAMN04490370_11623 [Eubacterium ruminantium]SJZ98198.1 hypothetical protein SAMN02745110_02236 [Eubacterium ruminantium]